MYESVKIKKGKRKSQNISCRMCHLNLPQTI